VTLVFGVALFKKFQNDNMPLAQFWSLINGVQTSLKKVTSEVRVVNVVELHLQPVSTF